MRVFLQGVRAADLSLFKARRFKRGGGPGKYAATFHIEPGSEAAKALTDAMHKVAEHKWGDSAKEKLWAAHTNGNVAFRATDTMEQDDGTTRVQPILRAYNAEQPLVVNRDRSVVHERQSPIYPGCFVSAFVDIWASDARDTVRIGATLEGVQFEADGRSLIITERASDAADKNNAEAAT